MPKIVVIAVKHPTEPNLYLHGLRRDNNKWAAPGGHAIEGETDLESARRELEEETGLRGVQLDKVANQKFGNNDVHLFTCDYPQEANLNSDADPDAEFLTFKWLDPTAHSNLHVPSQKNLLSIWMKDNIKKDEGVNLIHFSPTKGLKEISPAKMGTSGVGGAQYKRGLPEHRTSFFYTENSLPEDLVTQGAMSKYIVKAPTNVYDLDTDPHGFKKEARARNNGAWNEDVLHSLLKEKGYNGLSWEMRPGTTVTQLYHPHPVHEEINLKAELEKSSISRKTGVQSVGNTIPLKTLQQIKQDNYVGAGGKDYSQSELDDAILQRKMVQAKKMKLFKKPESPKTHGTFQEMVPPPMPVKMAKEELVKGLTPEELANQNYKFKIVEGKNATGVVAYQGRKKVGHLGFSNRPSSADFTQDQKDRLGYHEVHVGEIDPLHRGKGLYQHMLNLGAQHVKSKGSKGLVSAGNQRSRSADNAWDKAATHAMPFTSNAGIRGKLSPGNSDYYIDPDLKKARPSVTVEPFSADPAWFDPKKHDFLVKIHNKGEQIGMIAVTHKPQGIMPYQFNVHKDYRRMGLGTKIAQHAEKISNKKILASPDMTPAATEWLKSFQRPKSK